MPSHLSIEPRPTSQRSPTSQRRWLDGVRQVAVTSDRWFISCVRMVTRVTTWARREAGLVDGARDPSAPACLVEAPPKELPGNDGEPARPEPEALDLLLAGSGCRDALTEEAEPGITLPVTRSAPKLASEPAGVLPLWRALGRVVSQHAHSGYRTLQADERFWALLTLIQSLTGESDEPEPIPNGRVAANHDSR